MDLKRIFTSFFLLLSSLVIFISPVHAQSCEYLPPFLCDLVGTDNPAEILSNRIQVFFLIAFGAVILIAVAYTLYVGYKFISSKGDPGEMETSQKSMQSIFMGVGALFVGVLGIAVVLMFFGSDFITPHPACIEAPDSLGCYSCKNGDRGENSTICEKCDANTNSSIAGAVLTARTDEYKFIVDLNEDGTFQEGAPDLYTGDSTLETAGQNFTCRTAVQEVR